MAEEEEQKLLFFDTFSHDNTEELNLDLVQFQQPVLVTEIRVIPLNTKVEVNIPGGLRLGATRPSKINLQFFVNNLNNNNPVTFETLGKLDYLENVDIQFVAEDKIPTDGLILYGQYTTITVAVYGCPTTVKPRANSPPPPPPPQAVMEAVAAPQSDNSQVSDYSGTVTPKAVQGGTVEWDTGSFQSPPQAVIEHSNQPSVGHQSERTPPMPQPQPPRQAHVLDILTNPDLASLMPSALDTLQETLKNKDYSSESRDRDYRDSRDSGDMYDDHRRDRDHDRDRDWDRDRDRDHRDYRYRDSRSPSSDMDYRDRDRDMRNSREGSREPYRDRDYRDRDGRDRDRDKGRDRDRERDWDRRDRDSRDSNERSRPRSPLRSRRSRTPERRRSRTRSRSRSPVSRASSRSKEHIEHPPVPVQPPAPPPEPEPESAHVPEIEELPEEELYPPPVEVEPIPDESPYQGTLSEGELPEAEVEQEILEDISSDELSEDLAPVVPGVEWDDIEEMWTTVSPAPFNPYIFEVSPLETYVDPALTAYEAEKQKLIFAKEEEPVPDAAKQILVIVTQFKNLNHHSKWIEALESLPSLAVPGLVYLVTKTDHKEMLETLVDWCFEGLDINKAMAQPETAFKVRHLKMGIRLAALLCSSDSYVAHRMLTGNVQQKLLELMVAPSMSSSLKLLIIRALDCTTRLKDGIDWFLGRHSLQLEAASGGNNDMDDNSSQGEASGSEEKPAAKDETRPTGYQQLVAIMMQKQMVRPMTCLKALVRKIHVYELLNKFSSVVEQMAENSPPSAEGRDAAGALSGEGEDVAMETEVMIDCINEDEAEIIEGCLEEALRVLVHAENLIAQPKRTLPAQVKFCVTQRPYDPYPNLYHIFNSCRLLETLFVLVSSPITCSHVGIFCGIRDLVHHLLTTHSGLLYLSSRPETINGVVRALTQNANDSPEDSASDDNPAQQLGLQMVYPLQVLQLLDQLRMHHTKDPADKGVDEENVLSSLHSLYALAEVPLGREAVINVLGLEDNLKVLLPFLNLASVDEERAWEIKKSVTVGYVILLLHFVVKHSANAAMLLKYGPHILFALDEDFSNCKMSDRVSELQEWLSVFRNLNSVDVDSLDELIKQLKNYNEEMRETPKSLVTVLRVMQHMAIPPPQLLTDDGVVELKYKYVLVELIGADCLPVFVNIVQKVGELMLRSWQHGLPQNYNQGSLLLALVRPALALIKAIQCQLILARGVEYRDLTCLPCLFLIYTVCCSAPMTVALTGEAQQIQNDVVDTLMAFTQPGIRDEEAADALSSSLWTMMMRDLLKFVPTAPYTFLGGLMLISELIPLPLPLQTREILSEEEISTAVNHRKLWSAHLYPLQTELHEIIMQLTGSSCQPFQQVLRRVYIQISDLAAPSAIIIVRGVLDALLESMDATIERLLPEVPTEGEKHEDKTAVQREELRSSGHTSRILNLLAYIMNQPPIKATFLHLCRQNGKPDDKYHEMLQRLVQLLNVVSEKPSHVQAQEAIVSILQSLCDAEVTLIPAETSGMAYNDLLSCSLPSRDHLSLICNGLLEHIGNRDHNLSSVLPSLRTLTLLLDHDYGFYHLTKAVKAHPDSLVNLFMRINATFSKDSSDCIATLSSAAELLQFMATLPDAVSPPVAEDTIPPVVSPERKLMLSNSEVREMLGWTSDAAGHPLDDLEKLLQEYAKEEETLRAVLDSVAAVSNILKTDDDPNSKRPDMVEPVLGTVENLSAQFSQRLVYVIIDADEEDRVSASYWLPMPTAEESDQEIELVRCDFEEMIEKHCPEFDLKAELLKGTDQEDKSVAIPIRRLRTNRPSQDTINTSRMQGNNRGFVAPMRGRGFGRGMVNSGRHDAFRSRPPNTSRPPSMHVDDFVKMENQQNHNTPPQNIMPQEGGRGGGMGGRRMDKEGGGGRGGRGGRGGFNRRGGGGGFFSPGNGRRMDNMGNPRGGLHRGRGNNLRGARGGGTPRNMPPGKQNTTPKNTSPWFAKPARQSLSGGRMMPRGGHGDQRMQSADRRMREPGSGGRFAGPRGGRGGHFSREQDRYGGGMNRFQGGRDRGRHQRSFTK